MLAVKGFNVFAKIMDPCQPAQTAQADKGRKFLLYQICLYFKG